MTTPPHQPHIYNSFYIPPIFTTEFMVLLVSLFYDFSFFSFSKCHFASFFRDISYTCQSLATFWLNDFWYLSSNVDGKRRKNTKVWKKFIHGTTTKETFRVMSSYIDREHRTWPNKIFRDSYRRCLWDLSWREFSISSTGIYWILNWNFYCDWIRRTPYRSGRWDNLIRHRMIWWEIDQKVLMGIFRTSLGLKRQEYQMTCRVCLEAPIIPIQ